MQKIVHYFIYCQTNAYLQSQKQKKKGGHSFLLKLGIGNQSKLYI